MIHDAESSNVHILVTICSTTIVPLAVRSEHARSRVLIRWGTMRPAYPYNSIFSSFGRDVKGRHTMRPSFDARYNQRGDLFDVTLFCRQRVGDKRMQNKQTLDVTARNYVGLSIDLKSGEARERENRSSTLPQKYALNARRKISSSQHRYIAAICHLSFQRLSNLLRCCLSDSRSRHSTRLSNWRLKMRRREV